MFIFFLNEKYEWEIWDTEKQKSYIFDRDKYKWIEVIEDWEAYRCIHELDKALENLGLPPFKKENIILFEEMT